MVLQTIYYDDTKHYQDLGDSFQLIMKEESPEEFEKMAKADFKDTYDHFIKDCYGFVVYGKGSEVHPLYKDQKNYILERGQLFKDLCLKG